MKRINLMHYLRQAFIALCFLFQVNCNESNKEITVGYLPIIAHLPAFVSESEGFLNDIKVIYKVYGSSNDLLNDLIKGKIDCATTIAFAPIASYFSVIHSEGLNEYPIKIFSYSKTSSNNPFDGVFVHPNSEINSLNDIIGKKVGVFPGTTAKNILSYLLIRDYNLDPSTINWIYLPPSTQIESLRSGDIDVLFCYETVRTIAEFNNFKSIHGSVIASVLEDAPYGCSAINTEFFQKNKEIALAYINAFDRSVNFVNENPNISRQILKDQLSLSDAISDYCNLENRLTSDLINEKENLDLVEKFISVLINSGEISAKFSLGESMLNK